MRQAVDPQQKHQSFGISFPPSLKKLAQRRAYSLEIPLSKYLQQLVEADLTSSSPAATSSAQPDASRKQTGKRTRTSTMNTS